MRPSKNGRKDTPTVPSFSTERKGSLHRRRRSTAAQGAGGTRWVTMLGALIALLATVYLARLQMAPTTAATTATTPA
jgi:hypothetical protein